LLGAQLLLGELVKGVEAALLVVIHGAVLFLPVGWLQVMYPVGSYHVYVADRIGL
jgi:hypothetical protein